MSMICVAAQGICCPDRHVPVSLRKRQQPLPLRQCDSKGGPPVLHDASEQPVRARQRHPARLVSRLHLPLPCFLETHAEPHQDLHANVSAQESDATLTAAVGEALSQASIPETCRRAHAGIWESRHGAVVPAATSECLKQVLPLASLQQRCSRKASKGWLQYGGSA